MKKIVSILLAVLMLTAMFAGCAKKEAASPDAPAPTDADTVAVGAVIIARDDIPEDDVYKLVSTIFDNKDAITEPRASPLPLYLRPHTATAQRGWCGRR